MDNPSRPDEELGACDKPACDKPACDKPAYKARDVMDAAMADVLRSCDRDKLARHLGLAHASQAEKLIEHPAALKRLSQRLGDGCADLPLDEAVDVTRSVLGGVGVSP